MFVGYLQVLVGVFEFSLENFLEQILEAPVIGFQDGVLGG